MARGDCFGAASAAPGAAQEAARSEEAAPWRTAFVTSALTSFWKHFERIGHGLFESAPFTRIHHIDYTATRETSLQRRVLPPCSTGSLKRRKVVSFGGQRANFVCGNTRFQRKNSTDLASALPFKVEDVVSDDRALAFIPGCSTPLRSRSHYVQPHQSFDPVQSAADRPDTPMLRNER
jgi:hypothetical protein